MPQLDFEFRRATARDAEGLSAFAARVFPLGGRSDAPATDIQAHIAAHLTPERFCELIADPDAVVILASSGPEIAGYGVLIHDCRHPQIEEPTQAEVRKFYVDPQHHGQGLAHRLMRELLQAASPGETVWLSVFSENPRAIRFYERSGFRVVGKQDYWVGDDCQKDFVMRREVEEGTR
jgi:diamine N-acetyltransferase